MQPSSGTQTSISQCVKVRKDGIHQLSTKRNIFINSLSYLMPFWKLEKHKRNQSLDF